MSDAAHKHLQKAADKASQDSFFVGHLLRFLADKPSYEDLAERLQCPREQILRLALCRCPREQAEWFRQDINRIAAYIRCSPIALAQAVREATTMKEFSARGSASGNRTLLAARDRIPGEDLGSSTGGHDE